MKEKNSKIHLQIIILIIPGIAAIVTIIALKFIIPIAAVNKTIEELTGGEDNCLYPLKSESYDGTPAEREWWSGLDEIRTSLADEDPYSIIVNIEIGYLSDYSFMPSKLENCKDSIYKDMIDYFSDKTADYLEKGINFDVKIDLQVIVDKNLHPCKSAGVRYSLFHIFQP